MSDLLRIPLNLQFFAESEDRAEETSENTAEVAEQSQEQGSEEQGAEQQDTENKESEDASAQQPWKNQQNAGFAAARRQAEAELRARDARYAERFKGFTNPLTGAEIRSEADYFAALDAQEELSRRQELEQAGIDPSVLDELIARNPAIRQAQQILAQTQEQENVRQLEAELEQLNKLDPSVKTIDDILQSPSRGAILEKVNAGYSLLDAYKIVNFDKLTTANTAASKQAAINAMRGKEHMTPTGGVTDTSTDMEIPVAELGRWKEMFPDASEKELKEKYTRATKALG